MSILLKNIVASKLSFSKIAPFYLYSLFITAILFSFQYWLYWPGYIQDDSQTTFLLDKVGWHPVIMAYLVQGMYFLFLADISLLRIEKE